MKKIMSFGVGLVVALALVAATGCKKDEGTATAAAKIASCTQPKKAQCDEYAGEALSVTGSMLKEMCTTDAPGAFWKDDVCSKEKAIGSCTQNGVKTVHYEDALPASEWESLCKQTSGVWAAP